MLYEFNFKVAKCVAAVFGTIPRESINMMEI